MQQLDPLRVAQVEGQAPLVGVESGEDRPSLPPLVLGRRDAADQADAVGPLGRLEVDHIRAEQRQQAAHQRPGPVRRHVQDPQPAERERPAPGAALRGRRGGGLGDGVLAQPRRRAGRSEDGRAQPVRRPGVRGPVAGVGDEGAPLLEVGEGRDVRAVGDRCVRDAEGRRLVEDLVDGVAADPLVDGRRQRRAVQEELRVLGPLGVADHHAEVEPLLAGAAPQPDQPVTRRTDAGRRDEAAAAHGAAELVVERDRVVGEAQDQRLEHRHVDQPALGAAPAPGRQRPDGGEGPGHPLPDLAADVDGRPVGAPPGQADDAPGPGLQRELGGRPVPPRARQPEGRDGHDREVGVRPPELVGDERRVVAHGWSPATRPRPRPRPAGRAATPGRRRRPGRPRRCASRRRGS